MTQHRFVPLSPNSSTRRCAGCGAIEGKATAECAATYGGLGSKGARYALSPKGELSVWVDAKGGLLVRFDRDETVALRDAIVSVGW